MDTTSSHDAGHSRDKIADKIHYDSKFLMQLQFAPLSRIRPKGLPDIPEVVPVKDNIPNHKERAMSREFPLQQRFAHFHNVISTSTPSEQFESNVDMFEHAALDASLSITVVCKAADQSHRSSKVQYDLFLEDIWITDHCFSSMKASLRDEVFHKAFKILSRTPVIGEMTKRRRITERDHLGPSVIFVSKNGTGASDSVHTNVVSLKNHGYDLNEVAINPLEDMVVLQPDDVSMDQLKHFKKIVELSCLLNGMLLQYKQIAVYSMFSKINSRCQVYIQHQKMGDSYGMDITEATYLAFEEALFKLYEKQRVIRINRRNDQQKWISYDALKKEADQMRVQNLKPDILLRDETENPISYVAKAAYEKIKQLAVKDDYEIIFGPGMTDDEQQEIRAIGHAFNLKCCVSPHKKQHYIILSKHIEWLKLFEQLGTTTCLYGKYSRVKNKDIPKLEESPFHIRKKMFRSMGDNNFMERMDTTGQLTKASSTVPVSPSTQQTVKRSPRPVTAASPSHVDTKKSTCRQQRHTNRKQSKSTRK